MTAIPGLSTGSVQNVIDSMVKDTSEIELLSFDCKPYNIPESHRYGACRLVTEFTKLSVLGEGAFGTVYKVKDNATDEMFALKKLKIERATKCLALNFIREINILKNLNHENIIKIFGIAVGRLFETMYLILEYCSYELAKVLDDQETKSMLEEPQVKCIMLQLFSGVAHMHKRWVVHRDLTVSNILFSSTGILKIADFGSSRVCASDELNRMTPNMVSRWYRAPEILFGSQSYTSAVDVWSAGCIFAELLQKRPLFMGESDTETIGLIVDTLGTPTESVWPGVSHLPILQHFDLSIQPYNKLTCKFERQSIPCLDLLHKLLLYHPKSRITAEECVNHLYFLDNNPPPCDLNTLLLVLRKSEASRF